MDKPLKLTAEQLPFLKDFIRKRGFVDPVQINEILDHFACKVEEVLAANPKISLQQAMYDAHTSFGIMGFRPIVEAFEEGMKFKYKSTYWKTVKSLMKSPKWVLLIVLSFLLGFQITRLTYLHGWDARIGIFIAPVILWLLSMIADVFFFKFFNQIHQSRFNLIYKCSKSLPNPDFLILIFAINYRETKHLILLCVFFGLYYSYTLIRVISHYRTLSDLIEDYKTSSIL